MPSLPIHWQVYQYVKESTSELMQSLSMHRRFYKVHGGVYKYVNFRLQDLNLSTDALQSLLMDCGVFQCTASVPHALQTSKSTNTRTLLSLEIHSLHTAERSQTILCKVHKCTAQFSNTPRSQPLLCEGCKCTAEFTDPLRSLPMPMLVWKVQLFKSAGQ